MGTTRDRPQCPPSAGPLDLPPRQGAQWRVVPRSSPEFGRMRAAVKENLKRQPPVGTLGREISRLCLCPTLGYQQQSPPCKRSNALPKEACGCWPSLSGSTAEEKYHCGEQEKYTTSESAPKTHAHAFSCSSTTQPSLSPHSPPEKSSVNISSTRNETTGQTC